LSQPNPSACKVGACCQHCTGSHQEIRLTRNLCYTRPTLPPPPTHPSSSPAVPVVMRQYGLLYLMYPNGAAGGGGGGIQRVRPSAHLTVRWELPAGCIDGVGRPRTDLGGGSGGGGPPEPQRLMLGLFRLGVGSNTAGIISKKMFDRPPRGPRDPREMLSGTVPFYAPKSVRVFQFSLPSPSFC